MIIRSQHLTFQTDIDRRGVETAAEGNEQHGKASSYPVSIFHGYSHPFSRLAHFGLIVSLSCSTISDLLKRFFDARRRHRELKELSTGGIIKSGSNNTTHANDGRFSTALRREICVFDENRFDLRQP